MENNKYTLQSNQITLSSINLDNIYEKRLLNAFIDSLSPHLQKRIEHQKNLQKKIEHQKTDSVPIHINEQHELNLDQNKSIQYTYKLSDVEPNPQNYNRLRVAIQKLRRKDINIKTIDGTEIFTGLIESASLNKYNDYFKVKLSLTAYEFLLDLSKGYSIKSFKTALELKTLYSSYIYELICKWRNKKTFQIDIEDLRIITNTGDKYPAAFDFKKRVLESAKKELDKNKSTDLRFTYTDIKKGRQITGFKFQILHTENDTLLENKLNKQTSPKWDFTKEQIKYLNQNKINFNGKNRELLKLFFKKNGTNKALDLLETIKMNALKNSRENIQGYTINAIKNNLGLEN